MSTPREPSPAKLIVGLLFRDTEVRSEAVAELSAHFGPFDFLSEPVPFTFTDYYDRELGTGIMRQLGSFLNLVPPDTLPDIKLFTNEIEIRLSGEGRRRVNIDPGLLSEERLVLATGKNFTHRVYLRDGIFADLTLIYQRGSYRIFPWTYPDYREPSVHHYLQVLRQKLIFQRTGRIPTRNLTQQGVASCF